MSEEAGESDYSSCLGSEVLGDVRVIAKSGHYFLSRNQFAGRNVMTNWTRVVSFGVILAAINSQALGREETWQLSVLGFQSTWHLHISDADGSVTGDSNWQPNPSGTVNPVDGKIDSGSGQITLTRSLQGANAGETQTYSGQYINGGIGAQGTMNGFGGPGNWSATVTKH